MDAETQEASIDDRIANLMYGEEPDSDGPDEPELDASDDIEEGDEDEQPEVEADSEGGEDGPEFVEMEIDGQLYEVPKALEGHLLRDKDYTQKTQEISAQRKETEAMHAALRQQQAKYEFYESVQDELQQAETLGAQIKQGKQWLKENLDSLDTKDIYKARAQIEEWETEQSAITRALQTKQGEFQQAQEQTLKELLAKSTEAVRAKIPNWGETTQQQVREFALQTGFTEQELNSVFDPRYVEVLYKASQYDALQKGKGAAIKKVQDAPTIKPKSRKPMPKQVGNKLNLRKKLKSGVSDQDKAQAAGNYIADRFGM